MKHQNAIDLAVKFLVNRGYPIPPKILAMKSAMTVADQLLVADTIRALKAMKAGDDYASIRSTMWAAVYDNVYNYLDSNMNTTTPRINTAKAIGDAYIKASETAWMDGGSELPIDEDTLSWAKSELDAQLNYVDSLFQSLKQLRKEGVEPSEIIHEAFVRADGYSSSLDSFYNYVKTSGAGNKMLTFVGSDGRESCADCKRLKGQRHKASWWTSRDLVPPSSNFECGGYNCDHYLQDDDGNTFTV